MSDYKLVPIGPTQEMVEAAEDAYMPFGDMELAIRMAILAAPAVQGEPVGEVPTGFRVMKPTGSAVREGERWEIYAPCGSGGIVHEDEVTDWVVRKLLDALATAPQPAEQQPSADDSLTPVPDEVFAAEFAAWWEQHGQFCRAGGGDYERTFAFEAWRHLYPKLMKLQKVAAEQQPCHEDIREGAPYDDPDFESLCREHEVCGTAAAAQCAVFWEAGKRVAEQQPAPDVAELVEALKGALENLEKYAVIVDGERGSCRDLEGLEADGELPECIKDVRAALSVYRKGGK